MHAIIAPPREHRSRWMPLALIAVLVVLVGSLGLSQRQSITSRLPFISQPAQPVGHIINGAFLYQQQRPLSCEYASATIAATLAHHDISEYDFDALVPLNQNPHLGYRGYIHGEWGNTTDYGVYNEPLHAALSSMGIESTVIYAHGNSSALTRELDQDRPVVVWLAMRGAVNSVDEYSNDGTRYQVTQWMHVMTAYGYDESGVYLTDPGTAVYRFYPWDEFLGMWDVMDGMGLSVHP